MSGSSPSTRAESSRPSSVVSVDACARPARRGELVSTRPSGETMTPEPEPAAPAAVAHVDAHDARADAIDDVGDDARIGVERGVIDGLRSCSGTKGIALGVEDFGEFETGGKFWHAQNMVHADAGARSQRGPPATGRIRLPRPARGARGSRGEGFALPNADLLIVAARARDARLSRCHDSAAAAPAFRQRFGDLKRLRWSKVRASAS